ncbi:MAG: c-type cytochrome [Boseongicola sp.]|nr:MAG: c-type cytochrome [Boseongicola sp.]
MRRILYGLIVIGLVVALAGLWITRPERVDAAVLASLDGDTERGEVVYWAAGCASCHTAPDSDDKLALAGGQKFATDFGTFLAPNISPDPANGIGNWTVADFASAVTRGTSPDGKHYYPAFPYTSYGRMTDQDVVDLWAFMKALPAQSTPNKPHEVGFPFNIRLSLGGWKLLFFDRQADLSTSDNERGQYLVEVLGHCAECHTPRNILGGWDRSQWLAGAPNPSGRGRIPGLRPGQLDWALDDLEFYLDTGLTPDFDSAGGEMVSVIENLARLSTEDRLAIAQYILSLPASN